MDQEVAKTLVDLELKLQELERELTSIGRRENAPKSSGAPGKLIDEAVEPAGDVQSHGVQADSVQSDGVQYSSTHSNDVQLDGNQRSDVQAGVEEQAAERAADNAFGGPGLWGGEEVPAQAGATTERDWTTEVRETAYGEIPTPPPQEPVQPPIPPPQALDTPPIPLPPHSPGAPYLAGRPSPPAPSAIDASDLERFRDKLTSAMGELVGEYERLLARMPPSRSDG